MIFVANSCEMVVSILQALIIVFTFVTCRQGYGPSRVEARLFTLAVPGSVQSAGQWLNGVVD